MWSPCSTPPFSKVGEEEVEVGEEVEVEVKVVDSPSMVMEIIFISGCFSGVFFCCFVCASNAEEKEEVALAVKTLKETMIKDPFKVSS